MQINRFDTLLGYENTLSPMRAGKANVALSKKYRYTLHDSNENEIGVEVLHEREFIVYALQNGEAPRFRTESKCSNCKRRNCVENDSCATDREVYDMAGKRYGTMITKTGYNFALWLVDNGLVTFEAVQSQIEAEATAEREAQQKAAQAEEEQRAVEEAEKKAEIEYKKWLQETADNYGGSGTPKEEKIQIQRDIFMDMYGSYNCERGKELLVIIDNIDNPRCRRDIVSRLHNDNIGSIKTFECVTGIKLAKTHKARKEQLMQITRADFADKPKQYKPRKPREKADFNTLFYKWLKQPDANNMQYIEARGRLWQYGGFDFYIQKNEKGLYLAIEGRSGRGIIPAAHKTISGLQKEVKELIRRSRDDIKTKIEEHIKSYGISPLYNSEGNYISPSSQNGKE